MACFYFYMKKTARRVAVCIFPCLELAHSLAVSSHQLETFSLWEEQVYILTSCADRGGTEARERMLSHRQHPTPTG